MLPAVILAWVFYIAIAAGPFLAVAFWDEPPLAVGVVAGLFGFGVLMAVLVQGSAARLSAVMSERGGDEFHTFSVVSLIRAILAISWLVMTFGIWSSAVEHAQRPLEAQNSSDYALLALWQIGDVIPLLDVPGTLGFPEPPVEEWGLGTGIALLLLGFAVVFSILMVVGELVVRRSRR